MSSSTPNTAKSPSEAVKTLVDCVNKKWTRNRSISTFGVVPTGMGGSTANRNGSSISAATFALEEQSYLVQLMLDMEHNTGAVELCQSILGDFQKTARTYQLQMSSLQQARSAITDVDTEGVTMLKERVMVVLTKQRMLDIEIRYLENKIHLFQRRNRAFDEFNERLIALYSSSWPKSSIKKSQSTQIIFERDMEEAYSQLHKADMTLERYTLLNVLLIQGEKALKAAKQFAEKFEEESGGSGISSRLDSKYLNAMRICTIQADVAMKQAKSILPSLFKDYLDVEIFQDGWLSSIFRSDRIEDITQNLITFTTHHTALKPVIEQSAKLVKDQSDLTYGLRMNYHDAILSKENARRKMLYELILPSTFTVLEDMSGTKEKENGREMIYFQKDSLETKLDEILNYADAHVSKSRSGSMEKNEIGNGNGNGADARAGAGAEDENDYIIGAASRMMSNIPKRESTAASAGHGEVDRVSVTNKPNIWLPIPPVTSTSFSSSIPYLLPSRAPSPLNSSNSSPTASPDPAYTGLNSGPSKKGTSPSVFSSPPSSPPLPPVTISNTPATPILPPDSDPIPAGLGLAAPKPKGHFKSFSTSTILGRLPSGAAKTAITDVLGANLDVGLRRTPSPNPPRRPINRPPSMDFFDSEIDHAEMDGAVPLIPGATVAKEPDGNNTLLSSSATLSPSRSPSPATSTSASPPPAPSHPHFPSDDSLGNSKSKSKPKSRQGPSSNSSPNPASDSSSSQTRREPEWPLKEGDNIPARTLKPPLLFQKGHVPSSSTQSLRVPSPLKLSGPRPPSPLPKPPLSPANASGIPSRVPSPLPRPVRALPIPGQTQNRNQTQTQRSGSVEQTKQPEQEQEQEQERGRGRGQRALPIPRSPMLSTLSPTSPSERSHSAFSPSSPGRVANPGSKNGRGIDSPAPVSSSSALSPLFAGLTAQMLSGGREGETDVKARDEPKPESQAQAQTRVENDNDNENENEHGVVAEFKQEAQAEAEEESEAESAMSSSRLSIDRSPSPSSPPPTPPPKPITTLAAPNSSTSPSPSPPPSVTPPLRMFSSPSNTAFTNPSSVAVGGASPVQQAARKSTSSSVATTSTATSMTTTSSTSTSTTRTAPHGILKHASSQSMSSLASPITAVTSQTATPATPTATARPGKSSFEEWGTAKVGTAAAASTKTKFKSMINRLRGEGHHSSHGSGSGGSVGVGVGVGVGGDGGSGGSGEWADRDSGRFRPTRADSSGSSYSGSSGGGMSSAMAAAIAAGFMSAPSSSSSSSAAGFSSSSPSRAQTQTQTQSPAKPPLQAQRSRSPRFVDSVEIIPRPEVDSYPYSSDEDEDEDTVEQPPSPSRKNSFALLQKEEDEDEEEEEERRVVGEGTRHEDGDGALWDHDDFLSDYYASSPVVGVGRGPDKNAIPSPKREDGRRPSSNSSQIQIHNLNEAMRKLEPSVASAVAAAMDSHRRKIPKYDTFEDMLLKPGGTLPLRTRSGSPQRLPSPQPSTNTISASAFNRAPSTELPTYLQAIQTQTSPRFSPTRPPPPKPLR